jgi:hypothetical protein
MTPRMRARQGLRCALDVESAVSVPVSCSLRPTAIHHVDLSALTPLIAFGLDVAPLID